MNDETLHPDNLLNNDSFIRWVLYNDNDEEWKKLLRSNPDKKDDIEKARQLVLDVHNAEDEQASDINEEVVWSKIKHSIEAEQETSIVPDHPSGSKGRQWAVAAVVCLGLFFVIYNIRFKSKRISYQDLVTSARPVKELVERHHDGPTPLKIMLSDGSVVLLYSNSRVSYPQEFSAQKREVILSGKAVFDVTKDSSRPFYVLANETVTKVLGTRFEINAFDDGKAVTVHVKSGRVSIYKQGKPNTADPGSAGLVLLPNQKGTFNRENESLSKNLVEVPLPVVTLPGPVHTRFDDVVITDIFKELERVYGIPIIYDAELLAACIVSTTIRNQSLYDNLDVLCRTIGSSYKEVDAQIIIESKGCF